MVPRRLGEKMGTCERIVEKQESARASSPWSIWGKTVFLSLNPKGWDTLASDSRWVENHNTDLDVRAQRVPTATKYLAGPHPTWRKPAAKDSWAESGSRVP